MHDNRRFLLALLSGLLLAGGLLVGVVKAVGPEERFVEVPLLTTATLPSTSSIPEPAPTSTAAPPPSAPPATIKQVPKDPYAAEPVQEIGTIEIPKIGLTHRVMHGITMRNIDLGPSHWPGTPLPGENGNAVFAGHRVTKTRPFRNIDKLVPGDEVFFTVNGVRTRYLVTGHEIVAPTALWITDQTPTPTATLFACHPPGSARQRYVVRLALAP